MTPQTSSKSATREIRKRLPNAKSTRLRIMPCSLLHCVLQNEGVGYDPVSGLNAGDNFLLVIGEHAAGDHFHAAESVITGRGVHPLAVMQVQNGAGRDGDVFFLGGTVKGR